MSFDVEKLYALLPAIYRIRDLERNNGVFFPLGDATQLNNTNMLPLKSLLAVIAEQIGVLEENLAQLYDDQFIETCAEWVVPYIGDLIGYSIAYDVASQSQRTEVANTVSYRQRKGTATLVEQLVHDVTGWSTHVVEYFPLLASTQHMNLLRPHNHLVDLRRHDTFEHLNTPFDQFMHTVDVRGLSTEHRSYSIPSVGVFLWRLSPYQLQHVPVTKIDDYRYRFNPLGNDTQLFSYPVKQEGEVQLARPLDIVMPISRYMLSQFLHHYYGRGKSLLLTVDGSDVLPTSKQLIQDLLVISDLSDATDDQGTIIGWTNRPYVIDNTFDLSASPANTPDEEKIAIDPVRGRIAFPRNKTAPNRIYTSFYYGFSAEIGGGTYLRSDTFTALPLVAQVPMQPTIQTAIAALQTVQSGAIEITDSDSYRETLSIYASKNQQIEVRAAESCRPLIMLNNESGTAELTVSGDDGARITLNGLVISGGPIRVTGNISRLTLKHCTLVPGLSLCENGTPEYPTAVSLIIEAPDVLLVIDSCIVGAMQISKSARVCISDSIVDANDECSLAYSAFDTDGVGVLAGQLYIENSTVIGQVRTSVLELASNTIFLGRSADDESEYTEPVYVERRQEGTIRYSYIPPGSRIPRLYKCQPADDVGGYMQNGDINAIRPQFTSLRYGEPGYCQLSMRCPDEIRTGADDESEMGVFHLLFQTQREKNLNLRLTQYLRVDMQQGIGKLFMS